MDGLSWLRDDDVDGGGGVRFARERIEKRRTRRERDNLFAKSNNETNNSKQHKIQWQAAREA